MYYSFIRVKLNSINEHNCIEKATTKAHQSSDHESTTCIKDLWWIISCLPNMRQQLWFCHPHSSYNLRLAAYILHGMHDLDLPA